MGVTVKPGWKYARPMLAMPMKERKQTVTRGKQYESTLEQVRSPTTSTPWREAIDLVKELAHAKFDETVELAVRLGVDPRKADQIVRGTLSLPHGDRPYREGRSLCSRRPRGRSA